MPTIYDLDTPTLLVDLDRLERNIRNMAAHARNGGKALRPHTKTHKTPEIARMQIAEGARGLTVAKVGEAETYAVAGLDDFFIAHDVVGAQKVARLLALMENNCVRVGTDSREAAEPIGTAAQQRGMRVPMLVELDTGHGRAGTRSLEETLEVARFIHEHPGLELIGVFSHEGHLSRVPDLEERKAQMHTMLAYLAELQAAFAKSGLSCQEVSLGATPSAALVAPETGVTELRPGTYVFYDRMQVRLGAEADWCALTVLATVDSVRPDGRILLDAGTKSLASDNPFPDKTYGEIVGHPELIFDGSSEEHGHVLATQPTRLKVGDKVRIIPNHVCTCVNMHERLVAHRGEHIEATWTIAARGKVQ
jgi:D-serine deaminase-like pyridoxal phosphate-dependent protein